MTCLMSSHSPCPAAREGSHLPHSPCAHGKKVGHRVDAGVPDVPSVVFVLGATCLLSPFLRPAPGTHGSQPNPPASVSVLTSLFQGHQLVDGCPRCWQKAPSAASASPACVFTSGHSVVLPLQLRFLGNSIWLISLSP